MSDSFETFAQVITIEFNGPKGWEVSDVLPADCYSEAAGKLVHRTTSDDSVEWRMTIPARS